MWKSILHIIGRRPDSLVIELKFSLQFSFGTAPSGFGYSASKWTFSCVLDEAACDEPLFLISPSILRQRLLTFSTTSRRRKPFKTFDEAASI
jgi:hypothetical protein